MVAGPTAEDPAHTLAPGQKLCAAFDLSSGAVKAVPKTESIFPRPVVPDEIKPAHTGILDKQIGWV